MRTRQTSCCTDLLTAVRITLRQTEETETKIREEENEEMIGRLARFEVNLGIIAKIIRKAANGKYSNQVVTYDEG